MTNAIGLEGDRGAEYLEKIVQSVHHIPAIEMPALVSMLIPELDRALNGVDVGYWSNRDWQNLFLVTMRPFLQNVRDVRRYLNAAPVTMRLLNGEVAGADALALEALRVFLPRAYALLPGMVSTLTDQPDSRRDTGREETARRQIELLIDTAPEADREAVRQMIQRLFPSVGGFAGGSTVIHDSAHLKKDQRVAHPDVLRIYLSKTLPENVAPASLLAEAVSQLEDQDALAELLNGLEPLMLQDVIERLEAHVIDRPPPSKEPSIAALHNIRSRLPEEGSGMFSLSPDIALHRVVLRMLETVEDEAERARIVGGALERIETLWDRIALTDLVGHHEGVGHKLVPESQADAWLAAQLDEVLASDPVELVKERDFPRILYLLRQDRPEKADTWLAPLVDTDEGLLRLLRRTLSTVRSQTVGDVAVTKRDRLPWQELRELVGEEKLKARVVELRDALDGDTDLDEKSVTALELAYRYATGDAPEDPWGE